MTAMLNLLEGRRSAKVALLKAPGPSPEQLDRLLKIAARVPDHKKLAPWRFLVFEGDARARFGDRLVEVLKTEEKEPPSAVRLETERGRFMRAPIVIGVISRTIESSGAPEWEQILSAGAASFNLCLAANAMGYGTAWITEWYAYSPGVRTVLDLAPNERVAGFVYIGSEAEKQPDRDRPDVTKIVSHWTG